MRARAARLPHSLRHVPTPVPPLAPRPQIAREAGRQAADDAAPHAWLAADAGLEAVRRHLAADLLQQEGGHAGQPFSQAPATAPAAAGPQPGGTGEQVAAVRALSEALKDLRCSRSEAEAAAEARTAGAWLHGENAPAN